MIDLANIAGDDWRTWSQVRSNLTAVMSKPSIASTSKQAAKHGRTGVDSYVLSGRYGTYLGKPAPLDPGPPTLRGLKNVTAGI